VVTVIVWFFAQLGLFQVARCTNSLWLIDSTGNRASDIGDAFYSLLYNLASTWLRRKNIYNDDLSSLLPLLRGGIFIYVFIMAIAYVKNGYRMFVSFIMWIFFWLGMTVSLHIPFLDNPRPLLISLKLLSACSSAGVYSLLRCIRAKVLTHFSVASGVYVNSGLWLLSRLACISPLYLRGTPSGCLGLIIYTSF
jgi:hypothetical protein